jgi:hypothetical protein
MEISWIDRVRNEEVLHRVKEGHILRRNCFLKHVIEGNIEGRRIRGSRRKPLLGDLMKERRYWKQKDEALDRTLWRTRFGRGYGPIEKQTT